jgi:hypothetical protein
MEKVILTLSEIEAVLTASWAADTCSPDDAERTGWSPENPALGHCDITALLINDIFGGGLVLGRVYAGAEQQGYHWWNRLESGLDLDLTRSQFQSGQSIVGAELVERPAEKPKRRYQEYLLLRRRVEARLGPLPGA